MKLNDLKISKSDWMVVLQTIYAGVVAVGISYLIGFGTQADLLLVMALPLGLFIVALLAWLKPRVQLIAWSAVTAWLLSSVYLGTSEIEYLMLILVLFAAIAGALWSPWFLVGIWLVHPLWDLIPRDLPEHQHDLPWACFIYDTVVGLYILWRVKTGFFKDAVVAPKLKEKFLATGASRTISAIGLLAILALEISLVGLISMDAISVWLAVPVALGLIASTLWLPVSGRKVFWLVFTIWTGMTFAHSGETLELVVFGLMIVLAVLGYRTSSMYWVIAWSFHALWHFLPRQHLSHESALLMGHWMVPLAGFLFELTIAGYLLWMGQKELRHSSTSV